MPEADRCLSEPSFAATGESFWEPLHKQGWSGGVHGQVGAMHRELEQRLLAGSFDMTVIPLAVRPMDDVLARVSRATGWMALAGGFVGIAAVALALLG